MRKFKGLTLVEMLVTISVLGVLLNLALPSFSSTIERTKARKTADHVAQLVHHARAKALNNNKKVTFSVSNGSFCLQVAGATGVCNLNNDPIDGGVSVSVNSAATGSAIEFDKIYGTPTSAASVRVTSGGATRTVTVNILGLVTITG